MKPRIDRPASDTFTLSRPCDASSWWPAPLVANRHTGAPPEIPHPRLRSDAKVAHPDTIRVSTDIGLSPEEMASRMSPPVSLRVVADTGALDTLSGIIEANERMASALREIRDACAATTTRAYTTLSTIDGIARRGLL